MKSIVDKSYLVLLIFEYKANSIKDMFPISELKDLVNK